MEGGFFQGKSILDNSRPPDRQPISQLQAQRLAALTDLSIEDLAGNSIADISEKN